MVIHTEEIRILGDRAYSHGTLEYEITPKEGGETKSYSVKFLDVLAAMKNTRGSDGVLR
jgi:hypothetical protein